MKGFTLLETLIAMVMTAFILMAVYGAYTTNAEGIQAARDRAQEYQTARVVLSMMRKDLQGAVALDLLGVKGQRREMDGRRADRIEMITSSSHAGLQDLRTGIYKVGYEMGKDDETGEMIVFSRTQEALVGTGLSTGRQAYELTRIATSLEISYRDRQGRQLESWDSLAGETPWPIPSLVEVRLTLKTPSGPERVFTAAVRPELGDSAP
ncbi:MAG: prepilin-type N-terminal cleavage/methylation domain-containing protein [Thermodesulfobacteriota bacterium]